MSSILEYRNFNSQIKHTLFIHFSGLLEIKSFSKYNAFAAMGDDSIIKMSLYSICQDSLLESSSLSD